MSHHVFSVVGFGATENVESFVRNISIKSSGLTHASFAFRCGLLTYAVHKVSVHCTVTDELYVLTCDHYLLIFGKMQIQ